MEIIGLVPFVGVVVFGILFAIMVLKGGSLKIPAIGMGACFALTAAIGALIFLGIGPFGDGTADDSTEPSGAVESEGVGDGEDKSETGEPEGEASSTPSGKEEVSEQVLLDEQGITITAKGLDKDGLFGANLKVLIENNSQESVTVQSRYSSVNGYMVDTMFSADVAAGKKTNDTITFLSSDLEACGIKTIADMEFSFHIFNDDWETVLDSNTVTVKTQIADSYEYKYDDSGKELHNENGVRVVSKGFSSDQSIFGPGLVLFIENTTGEDVTVQVRDVSVNGFMVDTLFSEDIVADKCAITAITVMNSSLENNGIEEIEEMEFYFHVFGSHSWDTIFDTDKVIVKA